MADIPTLDTYLINLDRSPDRLAAMQAQLDQMGLPFARVRGVDGAADWDSLSADIDIPRFERNVGRRILKGEIGCYASHMAVWDRIIEADAPVALILEDDVVFHDDFMDAVAALVAAKDHWDMVKLNHIRAKQPLRQKGVGTWRLNAYLGPFTGMGAYLVTRDAVARLRPRMTPPTRPIDHELDRPWVHQMRHYGLTPWPSHVQDHGQSTITGGQFSGVEKFKGIKRLPLHGLRLHNHLRKAVHLLLRTA